MATSSADFPVNESGTIKEEYKSLETARKPYIDRARKFADVTLKYMFPDVEEGQETNTLDLTGDWQIDGPMLVNHLANVYLDMTFPVTRSFFKNSAAPEIIENAAKAQNSSETDIDMQMSMAEKAANTEFNIRAGRVAWLECVKNGIISGNFCLYKPEKANFQAYSLEEYVCQRDMSGNWIKLITVDSIAFSTLPKDVQDEVRAELALDKDEEKTKNIDLFTRVMLVGGDGSDPEDPDYAVQQAVDEVPVESTQVIMKRSQLRWFVDGWNFVRRENYGRGLIEDVYPSLLAISVYSQALLQGVAAATDYKNLVDPDSVVDIVTLNESEPGSWHIGEKDSVTTVDSGKKVQDLSYIQQHIIDPAVAKLSKVFMLRYTRNKERVTAEEIRQDVRELETAHGGVFSRWSQSFQLPLAKLLLDDVGLDVRGTGVEVVILTGMAALGRAANNDNINAWLYDLRQLSTIPEFIAGKLKLDMVAQELAIGHDVDYSRFIKTETELQEEQKQMNSMINQQMLNENAAKGIGKQVADSDAATAAAAANNIQSKGTLL